MAVCLISFPYPHEGSVEAQCTTCRAPVYEQQANLDRIKQEGEDGYVLCLACVLGLKALYPDKFPEIDAQLWEGRVRKPETTPLTQPLLDLLNAKQKP